MSASFISRQHHERRDDESTKMEEGFSRGTVGGGMAMACTPTSTHTPISAVGDHKYRVLLVSCDDGKNHTAKGVSAKNIPMEGMSPKRSSCISSSTMLLNNNNMGSRGSVYYHVTTAVNGYDALEKLKQNVYECRDGDVNGGDGDGYDAVVVDLYGNKDIEEYIFCLCLSVCLCVFLSVLLLYYQFNASSCSHPLIMTYHSHSTIPTLTDSSNSNHLAFIKSFRDFVKSYARVAEEEGLPAPKYIPIVACYCGGSDEDESFDANANAATAVAAVSSDTTCNNNIDALRQVRASNYLLIPYHTIPYHYGYCPIVVLSQSTTVFLSSHS
jgi:hypothetical protein